MKKHDEGYVLPFVLIAVLVISLVIASVMTIPLRNLRSQQAVIERMQDRYQAEGAIEKFVAELQNVNTFTCSSESECKEKLEAIITDICNGIYDNTEETEDSETTIDAPVLPDNVTEEPQSFEFTIVLKSVYNTAQITAEVIYTGQISEMQEDAASYKYTITSPCISYENYEISTGGDAS